MWPNVLCYDRHQSVLVPIRHHHHERVFAASLNAPEHPVSINVSPSVVFPLSKFGFINFYGFAEAANSDGMIEEILATSITEEIIPINSNAFTYLYFMGGRGHTGLAKKLLSRMLMTAWQPLRGHLQYSVPFLFTIWH